MKQNRRRWCALAMALVMVWSLVMVPAGKVEAAETIENALDSTKAVYVELSKNGTIAAGTWGANSPAVDLTQYDVIVHNNSSSTISDWTVTIQCSDASTWNAGWNGASRSGNTITIGTYKGTSTETGKVWSNAEIEAGETGTGAGFQIAASAVEGASVTITYNVGASSGEVGEDATATDPSAIGSQSDKVTATITASNISGEYHEYFLSVTNGLSESISDWIVAIPLTGVTSSEQWPDWAKVKTSYTASYLYLTPSSSSNGVIAAGGSFGSTSDANYKFNYKGSAKIDASKAVVYYKTGTSSSGAFDNVVNNANQASGGSGGSGSSSGGTSGSLKDTVTDKNLDIEYNYAKLLQESLYFYDANMCGPEVEDKCGLSWRGNCHTEDTTVTYNGKTIDVSGGFHDAGDHVKFGLPQGYSALVLALGYYEFGEAFDELGQTTHYQTIMDHFCDYFSRCTVYSGDSVEAFCYQVGDGNVDHGYWGAPENQTGSRPAYFATASNPATDEVCVAAAALAVHAANFQNAEKSALYLKTAKDLFAFAKKNSKACATEGAAGFYASSEWKDDYCSALAALYVATGDEQYKTELNANYNDESIKTTWVLTWDNSSAAAALLSEDWGKVHTFASFGDKNTAQGFKLIDGWGSARYNTTCQFLGLAYDKGNDKFSTDNGDFSSWATGQMKYLLGNNNAKRCFVVGYNENSSKYPHHRAASRSSDASVTRDDHYTLLGALVGGPSDANDTYADNQADYNCNEVALDYNAGFVGAAAGLYLLHKNDTDAVNTLATKAELEEIGVDIYYGGSASSTPVSVTGVTLDKTTATMDAGDTVTVKATVAPANATNKKVTWSSSDTKVATVTQGVVTAVAPGSATITAKTEDGSYQAECAVTVNKWQPVISGEDTITLECGSALKDADVSAYQAVANSKAVDGTFQFDKAQTIVSMADNGTTCSLIFTPKDTDLYQTATKTVTLQVEKAPNTKTPGVPELGSRTADTVTLKAYTGEEAVEYGYKVGDGDYTWTDSYEFTGLSEFTRYTFALRYAETDSAKAGEPGATLCVTTLLKDTYTVDLSKLADKDYVDAHNGTITYDADKKELTLEDSDAAYVLKGDGSDVTVVTKEGTKDVEVILDNASVNGVKPAEGTDITIGIIGDNHISSEGIISKDDVTIKNASTTSEVGKLEVKGTDTGAIVGDTITVESGEITATGTGTAPALKADTEIKLEGGTLTVTSETTPIICAEKITLDGCQVKSDTDDNSKLYQVSPVDKNGNAVTYCSVTYQDGENQIENFSSVAVGSTITLPALPVKQGYHAKGWKCNGSDDVLEVGKEEILSKDIVYNAVYEEITGSIVITQDTSAAALTEGYKEDTGITVSITNETNVSWEQVAFALDNDDFVLDTDTITALKQGDTKKIHVSLKAGKKASGTEYRTTLTMSVTPKELAEQSVIVTRKVNAQEKKVTGIKVTLDKTAVELEAKEGATAQVKATVTVTPSDATDKKVTWSSSNTAVATVDQNGTVTVKAAGGAKIEATAQDGSGVSGSATLTVTKKEDTKEDKDKDNKENEGETGSATVKVTAVSVKLEKTTVELEANDGATAKVKATATVTPSDAADKKVTWSSSNASVATVSQDGTVTAKTAGSVKITATAQDGSGVSGSATLTVTKKTSNKNQNFDDENGQETGEADEEKATAMLVTADVKKVEDMMVSQTMKLAPKKSMQLNVSFLPEDAQEEELTFTSSNPKVATVDEDGEITAGAKPGKTVITVKSENGLMKSFTLQVMKKAVKKVKLQAKTKQVKVGKNIKIKATLSPNKKQASNGIYWKSSNEKVLTVTQKGVVKGIKKGKAKITVTATDGSGKKATITIKVK